MYWRVISVTLDYYSSSLCLSQKRKSKSGCIVDYFVIYIVVCGIVVTSVLELCPVGCYLLLIYVQSADRITPSN